MCIVISRQHKLQAKQLINFKIVIDSYVVKESVKEDMAKEFITICTFHCSQTVGFL